MKEQNQTKPRRSTFPHRIILVRKKLQKWREKKFWKRIMYDGLGGKKGYDN